MIDATDIARAVEALIQEQSLRPGSLFYSMRIEGMTFYDEGQVTHAEVRLRNYWGEALPIVISVKPDHQTNGGVS